MSGEVAHLPSRAGYNEARTAKVGLPNKKRRVSVFFLFLATPLWQKDGRRAGVFFLYQDIRPGRSVRSGYWTARKLARKLSYTVSASLLGGIVFSLVLSLFRKRERTRPSEHRAGACPVFARKSGAVCLRRPRWSTPATLRHRNGQ